MRDILKNMLVLLIVTVGNIATTEFYKYHEFKFNDIVFLIFSMITFVPSFNFYKDLFFK